jgi:hypothetical protein
MGFVGTVRLTFRTREEGMPETDFFRFEALRTDALKELKPGEIRQLDEDTKRALVARHLLASSGMDLKGRLVVAHTAHGGGGALDASFNPLGFAGFNLGVEAHASLKGAKQRTVVVLRGPTSVQVDGKKFEVARPIVVNSFIGHTGEAQLSVGVDLSVGWVLKVSEQASSAKGLAPNTKNLSLTDEGEDLRETKPASRRARRARGLVRRPQPALLLRRALVGGRWTL